MKPDWKDAPEWANWLCWHGGHWIWAENEPYLWVDPYGSGNKSVLSKDGGRKMFASVAHMKFEESVEQRPEAK